jgi:4-hydroxymandelate oxidase
VYQQMPRPVTVRDFEKAARESLNPVHFDYVSGGAGDGITLRANEAGFARLGLLPRMLRGNEKRPMENGFHDLPAGMCCENMRGLAGDDNVRSIEMSAAMSWEHVDRLRDLTDLPIVVKGILHADDARIALLEILRGELDHTLALCGAEGAGTLTPELVVRVP